MVAQERNPLEVEEENALADAHVKQVEGAEREELLRAVFLELEEIVKQQEGVPGEWQGILLVENPLMVEAAMKLVAEATEMVREVAKQAREVNSLWEEGHQEEMVAMTLEKVGATEGVIRVAEKTMQVMGAGVAMLPAEATAVAMEEN